LIICSSGGLQVHRFGMPGIVGVLGFAGGALVSMAVVIAIAFEMLLTLELFVAGGRPADKGGGHAQGK
jgi:hypothetical protein